MSTYCDAMQLSFAEFGLASAGRLFNFFEEVLEDDLALQHEVEGIVELGMPRAEVGRCLAWLRSRAACGRKEARMDAERTARVPPERRVLAARRAIGEARPMPGPLATELMLSEADAPAGKRWPVGRDPRRQEDERPDARAAAEGAERERWLGECVDILREMAAPVLVDAAGNPRAECALRHAFGKRRTSTLKARVRGWRRWSTWAVSRRGLLAKATGADFESYLQDLFDDGCGPSVPGTAYNALLFFERAGGLVGRGAMTDEAFLKSMVENLMCEAARLRGKQRQEAPRLPLVILVALELAVMDAKLPLYTRYLAGFRLVKWWSGMRFDDTLGASPQGITAEGEVFKLKLVRTKTSGPDRRTKTLYAYIARGACFVDSTWFDTWFALHAPEVATDGHLGFDRDYLLPLPTADWMGCKRTPACHGDASALGRTLLESLTRPTAVTSSRGVVTWSLSRMPLLPKGGGDFWTEHSERKGLVSMAMARGVPRDQCEFVGRWSEAARSQGASSSRDYIQTDADVVIGVQREVVRGWATLDQWHSEADLQARLTEVAVRRKITGAVLKKVGDAIVFNVRVTPFNTVDLASRVSTSTGQAIIMPAPVTPEVHVVSAAGYASEVKQTPSSTKFWVGVSRKRSFRRLHLRGGCWYTAALVIDLEIVGPADFDEKCSRCFAGQATQLAKMPKVMSESEEVSSQEVTSSSSEP